MVLGGYVSMAAVRADAPRAHGGAGDVWCYIEERAGSGCRPRGSLWDVCNVEQHVSAAEPSILGAAPGASEMQRAGEDAGI